MVCTEANMWQGQLWRLPIHTHAHAQRGEEREKANMSPLLGSWCPMQNQTAIGVCRQPTALTKFPSLGAEEDSCHLPQESSFD